MKGAWVFHRGALGDSVLLWPRLRALKLGGPAVTLVTDRSKGRLAAREIGIETIDIEQERFHALWRDGASIEPVQGVGLVIDHVSGYGASGGEAATDASRVRAHLGLMFPGARIESAPPPTGADARAIVAACPGALAPARDNPGGAAVLHVGAGSEAKRWPMERWLELTAMLRTRGERVDLIAGEVEAERLNAGDRAAFEREGGRLIYELDALADTLRAARVFIGCDSGPTHLAAAMGVRTVALFGPTDPSVWGPVGAHVRIVAPDSLAPMAWLAPGLVTPALEPDAGGAP